MAKKSLSHSAFPPAVANAVAQVGEQVRIARKRGKMTLDDMASRMFVTRKTLSRLENGAPGVSLGVLASALWVLGLDRDLLQVASPEKDQVGIYKERSRLPKRVRPEKNRDDLDF